MFFQTFVETATILQLKTTNGTDMINTLENLEVDGGGDCQEYAISGLSKGKAQLYLVITVNTSILTKYLIYYVGFNIETN